MGCVNISGFMEYEVIRNTRLNIVMKMADIISYGLRKALRKKTLQLQLKGLTRKCKNSINCIISHYGM